MTRSLFSSWLDALGFALVVTRTPGLNAEQIQHLLRVHTNAQEQDG